MAITQEATRPDVVMKEPKHAGSREPLVSILIPAHNAEEWIADTISSALAQTWPRTEIIVVNDASTDRTAEVVREFECHGVRLVAQSKQGAAAARNLAYSLSGGEYIQWLDCDDLLSPDKIAAQVHALRRFGSKRTLVSCAWGKFLYRYYRAQFIPTALWCDLSPLEWLTRKMEHNIYMQTCTWLASRELLDAAGPWNAGLTVDDDGEFFSRVMLQCDSIRFVHEGRVFYRGPRFHSLSDMEDSPAKRQSLWTSMQLHVKYIRSLGDSARVRRACINYLNDSLLLFYPDEMDTVRQAQNLARELGGELQLPQLSAKYSWIQAILGWHRAKNSRLLWAKIKWGTKKYFDKTAFLLENAGPASGPRFVASRK